MSIIKINNSYCHLEGVSDSIVKAVKTKLTYTNDDVIREKQYLYSQIQRAGRSRQGGYVAVLKQRFKDLGPDTVCWLDKDNKFPTGLLHLVKEVIGSYRIVDDRKKPEPYLILRWNNKPNDLRYYQKEAVNKFIEKGRGVIQAGVGSGKTRMAVEIVKQLGVNTCFVVPSSALLTQAYDVFINAFGANNVQQIKTLDIKKNKKLKAIRIVTIQTLASLNKQGLAQTLLNDVDLFILDEAHHSASDSFLALLNQLEGIYFRLGLSGTYLRNDSRTLDLWGVSGEIIYDYPASKATKEGFLAPVEFNIIKLKGKPDKNYQKEYQNNYGGLEILESISDLVKIKIPVNKQILILVDRKDAVGNLIYEHLKQQKISCSYVTGDNSKNEIKKAIEDFNDKKTRILIGSTVFGEGVDIRSTDHLIMARGGKSEIAMTQAVGRAIRLYEGKKTAYVWDFNFRFCKYLSRHIDIRITNYEKQFAGKLNYYE